MQGLHLTADLYQCRCDPAWLTDASRLRAWCGQAVAASGLHAVDQLFHTLPSTGPHHGGVTATLLLAQSHVCLHTWPGQRTVTLDVYVGNAVDDQSASARALMDALVDRFAPEWTEQRSLDRGDSQA